MFAACNEHFATAVPLCPERRANLYDLVDSRTLVDTSLYNLLHAAFLTPICSPNGSASMTATTCTHKAIQMLTCCFVHRACPIANFVWQAYSHQCQVHTAYIASSISSCQATAELRCKWLLQLCCIPYPETRPYE